MSNDMYNALKIRLDEYDKVVADVVENKKDFDRILEKRRIALDRQHAAYNRLCEYFHDVNEARAFVANYEAEQVRLLRQEQEQKQKRDLLAESQAWEEIASWWDEPMGKKSNLGLCNSITFFWAIKGLTDSMYKRIGAELIKRGVDCFLYPPGKNRAERAALARSFAYQALKEELGK